MNNPNFKFLVRVGRILADCGADVRLESADLIEVDGRIVFWPHSAQHAADSEIRILNSWEDAFIDAAMEASAAAWAAEAETARAAAADAA